MRHSRCTLILLASMIALAVAGCAATPEDRWFQQRDALNTANRVYLAHVPRMTHEQAVHYGELLQAARTSLDDAKTQLPGGGVTFDATLDLVESLLARVAALEADATPTQAPLTETTPDERR